jgi:hypothetical protein
MLDQCFGLSSANAIAGDPLFDMFAALQSTTTPSWMLTQNSFGLAGALSVRLLQMGSPIVSLGIGSFDTHSYEVVDPQNKRTHPTQVVQLGRMLTGLELALKKIADPQDAAHSLWDSTVIFVCSEFGRGDNNVASAWPAASTPPTGRTTAAAATGRRRAGRSSAARWPRAGSWSPRRWAASCPSRRSTPRS